MAFYLHRMLLRQLKICSNRSVSSQCYTSKTRPDAFRLPSLQFIDKNNKAAVNLTPTIWNLDTNHLFLNGSNISSGKIIKCPLLTNLEIIEPPKNIGVDSVDDFPTTSSFELPARSERVVEKQAARLIVIRKKKMKKHKLRKLRKKMKFEWAKVRQRREMKKEKAFQAELIAQIKEAERFDASAYVAQKINKATEITIPRFWKGRRLPEFIIRQKMGLDKK